MWCTSTCVFKMTLDVVFGGGVTGASSSFFQLEKDRLKAAKLLRHLLSLLCTTINNNEPLSGAPTS